MAVTVLAGLCMPLIVLSEILLAYTRSLIIQASLC